MSPFPIRKMTFAEAADIIKGNDLEKLKRSEADQEIYTKYVVHLKEKWNSIGDFILFDKFGFPAEPGEDGKYVTVDPDSLGSKAVSMPPLSLRLNDFPYYFEDGVEHYCLWKLSNEVTKDEILSAVDQLKEKKNFSEFVYYINPPNLKSILEVHHAHILIKAKPVDLSFRAKRLWCTAVQKVSAHQGLLKYSALGFGIFGISIVARVAFHSRMLYIDIKDISQQFTLMKCLRLYVNYMVPFPVAYLLKYYFPTYLKR